MEPRRHQRPAPPGSAILLRHQSPQLPLQPGGLSLSASGAILHDVRHLKRPIAFVGQLLHESLATRQGCRLLAVDVGLGLELRGDQLAVKIARLLVPGNYLRFESADILPAFIQSPLHEGDLPPQSAELLVLAPQLLAEFSGGGLMSAGIFCGTALMRPL